MDMVSLFTQPLEEALQQHSGTATQANQAIAASLSNMTTGGVQGSAQPDSSPENTTPELHDFPYNEYGNPVVNQPTTEDQATQLIPLNPVNQTSSKEPTSSDKTAGELCRKCQRNVKSRAAACDVCDFTFHFNCERLSKDEVDRIAADGSYTCRACQKTLADTAPTEDLPPQQRSNPNPAPAVQTDPTPTHTDPAPVATAATAAALAEPTPAALADG